MPTERELRAAAAILNETDKWSDPAHVHRDYMSPPDLIVRPFLLAEELDALDERSRARVALEIAEAIRGPAEAIQHAEQRLSEAQKALSESAEYRKTPADAEPPWVNSRDFTPRGFDEATRTVDVVLATSAPRRGKDWKGAGFDEILVVDPNAVRLGRLNRGAPLLANHDIRGGVHAIVGAVIPGSAHVKAGELRARVKFSRSADGERIMQDVKDEIVRAVSIGFRVYRYETDHSTDPQIQRAVDWEPYEASVVAIPADPRAGFRLGLPRSRPRTSLLSSRRPSTSSSKFQPTVGGIKPRPV